MKKLYPRVVYAPVDKFYSRYIEVENTKDQQVKFPAISFWRISHEFNPVNSLANLRTPSSQRYTPEEIRQIFSMEIPMRYQLDIWANTDIDRDDLFTELMYALTLYPNINIYYDNAYIQFALEIESAEDISDVAQFEETGNLYRISVPLLLRNSRLFFYRDVKFNKHIKIDFSVNDDDPETIIVGKEE